MRSHDGRRGGASRYLRSDNGPEFVSRAILRWVSPPCTPAASPRSDLRLEPEQSQLLGKTGPKNPGISFLGAALAAQNSISSNETGRVRIGFA